MPRPVKVRVSYREDSAHLIRFEGAVLRDPNLTEEWRKAFADEIHQLAKRCLEADDLRNRRADAESAVTARKSKK